MSDHLDRRQRLQSAGLQELRLFFTALQFFTRLPIPAWVGFHPEWLSQSARYFPAVGVVVGAAAALVYTLATWVLPQLVAVLLSTAAVLLLTGALHEDGLTDAADGLGGAATRERALEIMADSRVGSFGVIAIGMVLALKTGALGYLPDGAVVGALLIAHPSSRLAASALLWKLDYAKAQGKAMPMVQRMSRRDFGKAAIPVGVVALLAALSPQISLWAIVVSIMAVAAVTIWLGRLFIRRLGGYTGDCLGATQQLTEVTCYIVLLALV